MLHVISCSSVHTPLRGRLLVSAWTSPVMWNFGEHSDILKNVFLMLTQIYQRA